MSAWFVVAQKGSGMGFLGHLAILFGAYFLIIWFLVLRPQRRAEEKRKAELRALEKNDEVLTTGGVIGVIVGLKDDEVLLRVDDKTGTRVRFHRTAILRKFQKKEEAPAKGVPADAGEATKPGSK